MWGFWDGRHWRPAAAIANGPDVTPNAAGLAYMNLYHNTLQTHIASDFIETRQDFDFNFRAFRGDYEVKLVDEFGRSIMDPKTFKVETDSELILSI